MFQIDHDPRLNRLTISVSGFWQPEDVPAFGAAVDAEARAARAISADFDVMVDSLDFPVQANEVADLLTNVMAPGMALTTGRAAIIVGSQLNKLQAERTLVHPRVRVFLSVADAQAWLAQKG